MCRVCAVGFGVWKDTVCGISFTMFNYVLRFVFDWNVIYIRVVNAIYTILSLNVFVIYESEFRYGNCTIFVCSSKLTCMQLHYIVNSFLGLNLHRDTPWKYTYSIYIYYWCCWWIYVIVWIYSYFTANYWLLNYNICNLHAIIWYVLI